MTEPNDKARPLRIDVHCHLGGLGTDGSGITVSRRFRRGFVLPFILRALKVKKHEMEHADRLYVERLAGWIRESRSIDRAVGLAFDGRYRDGELDREHSALVVPNDWSRDAARAHPDAFLYGASVNPERPDALDELDRVAEEGAVLVKWLPNVMGFDPAEKKFGAYYRKLTDLRLPLLSHCGAEFTLPGGSNALGDPMKLRHALDEGVTVIAAHCATLAPSWKRGEGFRGGPERIARLCGEHERLHADLSAMTSALRGFQLGRVLDDERLQGRLLDGSDFPVPPICWTQLGRAPLRKILAARREKNVFDLDRELKLAAGMPEEMTTRAAGLLRLP